jgi:hypothetical protein
LLAGRGEVAELEGFSAQREELGQVARAGTELGAAWSLAAGEVGEAIGVDLAGEAPAACRLGDATVVDERIEGGHEEAGASARDAVELGDEGCRGGAGAEEALEDLLDSARAQALEGDDVEGEAAEAGERGVDAGWLEGDGAEDEERSALRGA